MSSTLHSSSADTDLIDIVQYSSATSSTKQDKRRTSKNRNSHSYKTLENVIALIDDTKNHHVSDFQVSDKYKRAVAENIKNLQDFKCKAHRVYNSLTSFCGKMSSKDVDCAMKELEKTIEDGIQETQKLTDNIGEICIQVAMKYLKRLKRPTKEMEVKHCRQFKELDFLNREYDFISTYFGLMNIKQREPEDCSESIEPNNAKFSENCCLNLEETKCNGDTMHKIEQQEEEDLDKNMTLLKTVIMNDINLEHLDEITRSMNSSDTLKKIEQMQRTMRYHKKKVELYDKKLKYIQDMYQQNLRRPLLEKDGATGLYNIKETDLAQIAQFEIEEEKLPDYDQNTVVERTKKSPTYTRIRDMLLAQLTNTTKVNEYIDQYLPIVLPDMMFKTTQVNVEKVNRLFYQMYRCSKYMHSFVIMTTIGTELLSKTETDCKDLKDHMLKNTNPTKQKACLADKSKIRYNFMYTILQKYFAMYLNLDEFRTRYSGGTGALAFGTSNNNSTAGFGAGRGILGFGMLGL